MIKNLFDVALLFEAAELGGSKGRAPAAMPPDEGGVPNDQRAFEAMPGAYIHCILIFHL